MFSWKYQNLPDFWLIKEGNDISNIHSKFQDHTSKNLAILNNSRFYMYFSGRVVTTPLPSDFDGLPYPWGRRYDHTVLTLINAPGALQFFKRGMFIRGKFSMQKCSG